MTITQRTLGTDDAALTVSSLGLGCMGMSEFYGTPDEQGGIDTIHRALDLGVTFLDTADMYGPFTNEQLVGKAIDGPPRRGPAGHQVRQQARARTANGSASTARRSTSARPATPRCSASASTTSTSTTSTASTRPSRSRRPSARWPSSSRPARSATSGSPRRAPATIRAAHAVHPITALQTRVLPVHPRPRGRDPRRARASSASGWSPTPRSAAACSPAPSPATRVPTARGTTGARRTSRASRARPSTPTSRSSRRSRRSPTEKGCTPGQLALAWVLAQGDDVVPIPGTKRVKYLEENVAATDVELTAEDLDALEQRRPPRRRRRRPLRRHVLDRRLSPIRRLYLPVTSAGMSARATLVTCTVTDGIAHVRLTRPDKLNALTLQTLDELVATAHELRKDRPCAPSSSAARARRSAPGSTSARC